jgi:acyl-CoA synthetase (AMP-forming)/AMP-acid ligase II
MIRDLVMIRDLYEYFESSVRDHAGKTAIVTPEGEAITYLRLGEIIEGYTARASRAGMAKGSRVTLHGVSMTQYFCLIVALSRLGFVHVRAPDPEGSGGVVADYVIVNTASGLNGPKIVAIDLAWPGAAEPGTPAAATGFASEDDICVILGTSGSTGLRKQFGLSLHLLGQQMNDALTNLGPFHYRTLLHIPLTLSFGLMLALVKLRDGQQIVLPGRMERETLSMMKEGLIDDLFAPPAVYSAWIEMLKTENMRLATIKRALIGGSIASKALLASAQEFICKDLINCYGSSEVGGVAAGHADEMAGIEGAVGRLRPWVEVRITDDEGRELPKGQIGQLAFRLKMGRKLARYMDDPPADEEDWFVSGDVGTLTPDGILCIQGRVNEVMNVGGNKISPALVEAAVSEFLATTEPVASFGMPGPGGFDEAVVVVSAKCTARLKELPAFLDQSRLGLGRVHMLAVKSFPLNEFGKVDKLKLRDMVIAEVARQRAKGQR